MTGRPCRTISPGQVTAATGTRDLKRVWTLRDTGRSAALPGDGAAPEFEAGHIERSLELMQRALTEAADNVPFKAPYSADAFPGP